MRYTKSAGHQASRWPLACLLVATLLAPETRAAFIPPAGNLVSDDLDKFEHTWSWDLTSNTVNDANKSAVAGVNWVRQLVSNEVAGSQGARHDLVLEHTHVNAPRDSVVFDPHNPRGPDTLTLPNIARGDAFARAATYTHDDHLDIVSLSVDARPGGNPNVRADGRHRPLNLSSWSYKAFRDGCIRVQATFESGGPEPAVPDAAKGDNPCPNDPTKFAVTANQRIEGVLPGRVNRDGSRVRRTDYDVAFEASPSGSLELAFLGEVDGLAGEFRKLDLEAGFALFGGVIEAPLFTNDAVDLFAAVDLLQWLSFPAALTPLASLTITDGRSDLLPGYVFSTSPIVHDVNAGFIAPDPFTGEASFAGIVDGKLVPEPATLVLILWGLAFAGLVRPGPNRRSR